MEGAKKKKRKRKLGDSLSVLWKAKKGKEKESLVILCRFCRRGEKMKKAPHELTTSAVAERMGTNSLTPHAPFHAASQKRRPASVVAGSYALWEFQTSRSKDGLTEPGWLLNDVDVCEFGVLGPGRFSVRSLGTRPVFHYFYNELIDNM